MVTASDSSDSLYSPDSAGTHSSFVQQQLHIHPSAGCLFKRLVDVVGACVGLALLLPIAIGVAIANHLHSPGPLFYRQLRCGLNGQTFMMWKFRSMVVGADRLKHTVQNQAEGLVFKNENDPRVTPVGRFLRRTSLDELPQFWNVLKGDMSLVGTRPPTLDEVSQYQPHHWQRLCVKPGITGEWQANGRSTVKDFEDIVLMDIAYQQKWSLLYDISLILRTIWVVFKREGAY
jgi:lipopolysaccharide/colanic/teichoic acid biosynthesis glycosyltransferase